MQDLQLFESKEWLDIKQYLVYCDNKTLILKFPENLQIDYNNLKVLFSRLLMIQTIEYTPGKNELSIKLFNPHMNILKGTIYTEEEKERILGII